MSESPFNTISGPGPSFWGRPLGSPIFGFRCVPSNCAHCFCLDPSGHPDYKSGHKRCCNCGIDRASPAQDEEQ